MTDALLTAMGFLFMVAASGASFVFGAALVCRMMAWVPMNIIVNVYRASNEDTPAK